jgi:hypothetical protein
VVVMVVVVLDFLMFCGGGVCGDVRILHVYVVAVVVFVGLVVVSDFVKFMWW